MNLSETALMLAQMQAYDQRTVGESDVIAWQALLVDASFQDCQEAIRRHYAEETDRIMPAHVRRLVRDIARERSMSPWAPGQHGVPRGEAHPEISGPVDENAITSTVRALLESTRAMLPEGSREALMPRTAAWERVQAGFQRQQDAEPNPLYNPEATAARQVCRDNGPHDDGYHIDTCPDGTPDRCTCNYNGMSGGHADGCPLATR